MVGKIKLLEWERLVVVIFFFLLFFQPFFSLFFYFPFFEKRVICFHFYFIFIFYTIFFYDVFQVRENKTIFQKKRKKAEEDFSGRGEKGGEEDEAMMLEKIFLVSGIRKKNRIFIFLLFDFFWVF